MFTSTPIRIIGLAGGAGVGKDTLAHKYFRKYGFLPFALADEIKVRVVASGRATFEEVYVTKPPHVRHLLQQEGTELGRNVYGEDVWVDQAITRMQFFNLRWGFNAFVITDVRFPNEVRRLQEAGGEVYAVVAPQRYAANGLSEEARVHASERALDGFVGYNGNILNDIGEEATAEQQIRRILFAGRAIPADVRFGTSGTPSIVGTMGMQLPERGDYGC